MKFSEQLIEGLVKEIGLSKDELTDAGVTIAVDGGEVRAVVVLTRKGPIIYRATPLGFEKQEIPCFGPFSLNVQSPEVSEPEEFKLPKPNRFN